MKTKALFNKFRKLYSESESRYILEVHIEEATRKKGGVTPRLLRVLSEILSARSFRLTAEEVTASLAYENKTEPFREEELLFIDQAVSLVLLRALTSCPKEERQKLADNAAYTLRSLEASDTETRYESLSTLEAFLTKNDAVYALSDKATKNDIKGRITHLARKRQISEQAAASLYLRQKEDGDKPNSKKGLFFFLSLYLASLLLTLATVFFGVPALLLPLLFFPIFSLVKTVGEELLARRLPSHPIPKLSLDKIPDEGKTLVVIPTLLVKEEKAFFEKIERFYLSNKDNNLLFGLLFDYADANEETTDADRLLADFAENEIDRLNRRYGERFFLAIRRRSYSRSEKKWIGWERKRGAIIDLVSYLYGEKDPFALITITDEELKEARYLVTLDADTDLYIGAVRDMVSAMLHPDNCPVIEKGAVRKGYGVLQPRMAVTAESACKSRFSLLMCGSGGIDPYASAAFDTYQNLFGEGIFCGKGIIDIAAFHEVIPQSFENEAILSHDLVEGNLLRAGFLSDVVLTDSFPSSPLAFYTRMHRWQRGDIQALPYAFSSPKGASGKRRKNPVSALGKYKLFDNLRRLLVPVASLLALLFSLFYSENAELAVALSLSACFILPALVSLLSPSRGRFRRYFSRILTSFGYRFMNTLYQLSSLAHEALLSLDALSRSLFRMFVSKRHLLLWTTAARAEARKDSSFAYIKATAGGIAVGILLLTFAESAPLRLFALLFLTFPLLLVLLSHSFRPHPRPLSKEAKARLSRYVFDMWGYFDKFVTAEENYLPPDNYQKAPIAAVAHRTSPTNIGMYLLSCLAARDFGFIDSKELLSRVSNTLSTLEKMPKKFGHLYNWYDTKTLALLGKPFLSTVDSGNFVVSLVTLTEGLAEYAEEESGLARIIYRYERLIEATDFTALYCEKRKLFYISRDSDEPSPLSCYDLYMSEARTTSYYAVACGILPKKHWEKLARITVGKGRYTGLASWSGTAFEYFMPHLFLPIPKSSLADEALSFTVNCQKKKRAGGLFGISESAYYAFDADMNYQYRAHGVKTLALDIEASAHTVLSPYSSFLMLATAPHAALSNLDAFRKKGVYGEHGFYEAIDFSTPSGIEEGAVIRSFMSHHIGMSILASANACFDNIFVRRFMRDPRMASARGLLEERIPTDAMLFRGKLSGKGREKQKPIPFFEEEKKLCTEKASDRLPKTALFSNQSAMMLISSSGEVALSLRDIALTYPTFSGRREEKKEGSLRVVYAYKDKSFAAHPELFSYSGTRALFTAVQDKLTVKLAFTLHGEMDLFGISFSASGGVGQIAPTLFFEPILTSCAAFFSHPFYRALSIEAFYEKEEEILYYRCRQREEEGEKWLAVFSEGEGELDFDTRKDILPFGYGEEDLLALSQKELPCRTGAVVAPYLVMRRKVAFHMGKASVDFLIASGSSRSEVKSHILAVKKRGTPIAETLSESLRPIVRRMLRSLGEDRPDQRFAEVYLSAVTNALTRDLRLHAPARIDSLWSASLSGDYPIITLSLKEKTSGGALRMITIFLKLHRLMREKGLKTDLVFLCRESDSYNKPVAREVGRLISESGSGGYLSKKGGVYLIGDERLFDLIASLSCLYLVLDKDSSPEELYYRITGRTKEAHQTIRTLPDESFELKIPENALRCEGGYFDNDRFTVIKKEVDTPRSFVYASASFGTLVSASSPGYTWLGNSKECRVTSPSDDLLKDITDERVIAEKEGVLYDLLAMSHTVEYGYDSATYRGSLSGEAYTVRIGIDLHLPVKLILAELPEGYRLDFFVKPSLGVPFHFRHLTEEIKEGSTRFYRNYISPHLADRKVFVSPISERKGKQGILFGVIPTDGERLYCSIRTKYHDTDAMEAGFLEYARYYRELFSSVRFDLAKKELAVMLNHFVPYQAYVIRMLARSGYHQSGGAYGFRDQLQDSLAMLYYDARITRRQILRAASHQYTEGDVQHWWHPLPSENGMGAGVRTRISDDMLWLPYAVAKYCRVTGDDKILSVPISYLDSPPLADSETDRYESPKKANRRESLYRHCLRAIDASYQLSPRGIPLIGGGDWNDAFNRVGILGKGESVFLARFMQIVFKDFAALADSVGDKTNASLLRARAEALSDAVDKHAWENDRYLRGSYDSGAPLGSASSRACRIDFLAESFSALAEGVTDRTEEAMRSAYKQLFDAEYKLAKLFTPPFSAEEKDAGYISAYCEGFRENGGQYNHGALFAARGYYALGEKRKGYELLEAVNPAARSLDPKTAKVYRAEPYALCGDIYTNPAHMGRGGWSLYTGAAGWFLTTALECLFGYREEGDHFTLTPALTDKLSSFSMKLTRKNTVYRIHARLASDARIRLDGKPSRNCFFFDGGEHILEMDIEKREKL